VAAKTRRSGIGIRRRAQACRERTPTATTTATTVMYRALRNKPMHTSSTELHGRCYARHLTRATRAIVTLYNVPIFASGASVWGQ